VTDRGFGVSPRKYLPFPGDKFGIWADKKKSTLLIKVKVKQSHYRPGQAQRVLRKLRFPDFVTTAQDCGRLSALRTGRLYPRKYS